MIVEVESSKARCDVDSIDDYVALLNGVAYDCQYINGYTEGNRNTIAVDLTVGCYMLGLDPLGVLETFENNELISELLDDEFPAKRVKTVLDYTDRFSWEWMIDADSFAGNGKGSRRDDQLVTFKLV
jgi:hypothetical protein